MRPSVLGPVALLFALAIASVAVASGNSTDAVVTSGKRALKRRSLLITDSNFNEVQVIHVAAGVPTTLSFRQPLRAESVILADVSNAFLPVKATESSIVLIPKHDLSHRSMTTLTVTLADGTILPLLLTTIAGEADIGVDINVALVKQAPPESATVLKASLVQLRAELDECRADQGSAGIAKLASLVLQQDLSRPTVFERHELHRRDKQERLLVDVRQAYRIFGHTYLVLTLENRDPSRIWVLDHPELALTGSNQSIDVQVVSFQMDTTTIAPNETGKVVVAFQTPPQGSSNSFSLQLLEKNGSRHVRLDGLSL
ncbi:MAG: DUF2381 family protein [Myxococcaceae bacterium]